MVHRRLYRYFCTHNSLLGNLYDIKNYIDQYATVHELSDINSLRQTNMGQNSYLRGKIGAKKVSIEAEIFGYINHRLSS